MVNGVDMLVVFIILFAGLACFAIWRLIIELMYDESEEEK